ncbi:MAG: ABC transporter ATP-binding protein [Bacillota bacterium]|nr:ABC transporter ATP-binding protein [Bacillota bacterium]
MADDNILSYSDEEEESQEESQQEEVRDVLVIEHLKKSYGRGKNVKEVLKDLNLIVHKGEVFGFIGKNGIGKSTTIDCIVGLKEQDEGEIFVNGQNTIDEPLECKASFGYVPSEPVAYEMMSGNEYLQFIASAYYISERAFRRNYAFLIRKFDLSEADMNRKIAEYSHGMKQKICLMASLIHNPKLWILDEPTVGLDIMVYDTLVKMIREFANNGRTVFITSHNIDMVSQICDRVAIINEGRVVRLYDLNLDPIKRRDLGKIFFKVYEEQDNGKKEKRAPKSLRKGEQ